ncbi:VOC family protein [Streptomyces violascens]|uniref:VOC family protein n=1 Tax=Streptomyces violascens TaxID=67381 RepID=UPI001CFE30D6|nr:VOC family protein [Streptomyces violascens]
MNIKAVDDTAVGRFRAQALGRGLSSEAPGVTSVEPGGGFVWPDPPARDGHTVPDRVHVDLLPYPGGDQEAEVARLRALGATDVDLGRGDVSWTCVATPEGHELRPGRVLTRSPGPLGARPGPP